MNLAIDEGEGEKHENGQQNAKEKKQSILTNDSFFVHFNHKSILLRRKKPFVGDFPLRCFR